MVDCKGYVIAILTVVCFAAAWPQQRSTQATNRNQGDLDRVVWDRYNEEATHIKSISTPANSPNIPRPSATKSYTLRSQRLQVGGLQPTGQDNETTSQPPPQQQHRAKSQSGRTSQVSSQHRRRNNTSEESTSKRAASSRAISSHQQDGGLPVFQPRAHQAPVNRTKVIERAVGGTRTQNGGGSGGRTTTARAMTSNASMEAAQEPVGRNNISSTRVKLPSESSIVFPGPSQDNKHSLPFVPRIVGERPSCASEEDTFCTESSKEYPNVHLDRILEQTGVVYRNFFTTDVIPDNNSITQRFDNDDTPLCMSEVNIVFPKQAQNKDNEWLYIVNLNDDEYRQGVRIEKCSTPDMPCAYSEGFPLSVETSCKQKYIYRQMLAVSQDGMPKPDSFKLPSCCACHTRSGVMSRMGVNPITQSPAPKRRRRRS